MCSGEIINKRPRRFISSIQYLGGDDHASLRYVPSSRCKFLLLERERNRKVQGSRPVPPSSLAHRLTGGWPVFQVASGSRLMLLKQLCVSSERGFGVVVVGGKHKITVVWLVYWTPTLLLIYGLIIQWLRSSNGVGGQSWLGWASREYSTLFLIHRRHCRCCKITVECSLDCLMWVVELIPCYGTV